MMVMMKMIQNRALSFSLFALAFRACYARLQGGNKLFNKIAYTEPPENMFEGVLISHPTGNFEPLECNADLDNSPCTAFSTYFDIVDPHARFIKFDKKLTIPCGMCVVMDEKITGVIDLFDGIDIQGKLLIPDGTHLRMRVTSILVQGELEIVSTKAIDGNPDVHILWLSASSPVAFIPPNNNNSSTSVTDHACGGKQHACDLGRKPFVVAGGKVNIRGLPKEDMPTWVPLYDVDATTSGWTIPESQYQTYLSSLPHDCPQDGVLIDHGRVTTTETASAPLITASRDRTGPKLRLSGHHHHLSPLAVINLQDIRHCLQSLRSYEFTAKVKLSKKGSPTGEYTECAKSGNNCLSLARKHENSGGFIHKPETVWTEHQSRKTKLGEAFIVTAVVSFHSSELFKPDGNEVLQFLAPDREGIDIEILDLNFFAPPPEAFSTAENVCNNMVPANGDAELFEWSPFPFRTNDEAIDLVVAEENYNRFFQVTGRASDETLISSGGDTEWSSAGMTWSVPYDCIKRYSTYRIHADVRPASPSGAHPLVIEFYIRGEKQHGSKTEVTYELLAACPPSTGDWVSCDGDFTVPESLVRHSSQYSISIRTLGQVALDYHVDNLSFELMEGGIDRLILPESIKGTWSVGAQLMLTSHTRMWDTTQLVKITNLEDHIEEGFVNVQIDDPILRPTTGKENPLYATEVALMSRNIVFDGGSGAHFTILHTPDVPQIIQGADFSTFGSAGERDRYPILFDNCGDSTGSMISKNTIRRSRQRCVVLHATNNVLVEGNIAHDTAGHCYALESGAEVGNMFLNNLGATTRPSSELIPQFGISGKETDDTPATFWITNPNNQYIGNVAAGSHSYGFWMSLSDRSRGPHAQEHQLIVPSLMPISHFASNAAHSISDYSLKVTGYHSKTPQSIVGFRTYLGPEHDSFEFSSTENVTLKNLISDKPFGNSNKIPLKNATVVQILGCDTNATAYLDFLEREEDLNPVFPSSFPSSAVFNLQE